jgi:hypothetical protein
MMLTLGGSSAILAHNLAALGSRVGVQSRIGDDNFGETALQPPRNKMGRCFARAAHAQRSEDGHSRDFAARDGAKW